MICLHGDRLKLGDATIGANKDGLFHENLINSLDYNQGNVVMDSISSSYSCC